MKRAMNGHHHLRIRDDGAEATGMTSDGKDERTQFIWYSQRRAIEIREVITALWTEGGRNGDETVSGSTLNLRSAEEGSMDRAAKSKAATIMASWSL